jgi:polysaccharide export outer membrane protein
LQTNDIISITIKAIDPKLVAMFNPTNEGNMQGKSESGLYFLMVLQLLMIMVPLEFLFGELNVIGYTLEEIRVRIEKQLLAEYFNKEANILLPLNWVVLDLPSTE